MNVVEELRKPEIRALRERYHELTGFWQGYHWECFGSIEDFKEYLQGKIAEEEKKLADEKNEG